MSLERRPLGRTGLKLSVPSFGASSLGHAFRPADLQESIRSVHLALDLGMNFIDTSPFYGCGISEAVLGFALKGVPRERYLLGNRQVVLGVSAGKPIPAAGADHQRFVHL